MRTFEADLRGLLDQRWRRKFQSSSTQGAAAGQRWRGKYQSRSTTGAVAALACVGIALYVTHHGAFSGLWKSEAVFDDEDDIVELVQTGSTVRDQERGISAVVTSAGLEGTLGLICCKDEGFRTQCPNLWGQSGDYHFHLNLSADGNRLSGEYFGPNWERQGCIYTGLKWDPWVLTRVR